MKSTKYLFNIEPEELDDLTYWDALDYKLAKGWDLFIDLYNNKHDPERLFYVNKAVEHTRELKEERDERCT